MKPSSVAAALPAAIVTLAGKDRRKLTHNTYLRKTATGAAIQFHDTDIIAIGPQGIRLDSGGFRTYTTKERLNEYLPQSWHVYSVSGVWYVARPDASRVVFADGMILRPDGSVDNAGSDVEQKDLARKVKKYADAFAKAAIAGKVEPPGLGDCMYCGLVAKDGANAGKPMGDAAGDTSHIVAHLDESYLVPSLLANAARETSSRWLLTYGLPVLWDQTLTDEKRAAILARDGKSIARDIRAAVRKYVGKRVGLALR